MIISLQPLILLVESLDDVASDKIPSHLYTISVACSDNFLESLEAYRNAKNLNIARQMVRLYHLQLLRLYQKLDHFCTSKNLEDQHALRALEELLERIEFLFKNDIDANTALPLHYQQKIRSYMDSNMPYIGDKLARKKIPQAYLNEILSAINSLFEDSKIPYIQYRHQDYLIQFVDALRQLAKDDRHNKNWHYRFLVLMVNFNFNHMGFFNRWKEMYKDDPSFMDGLLHFPKHFSCIRDFAYDHNRASLLKLMCEHIQTEHIPAETSNPDQAEFYIHSNLNGKELKLWMHLCVNAKVTKSLEKKEVAIEFSRLVKTREGTLLSPHSLTKMDKGATYDAAVSIQRKLKAMLDELDDRFPGLNR